MLCAAHIILDGVDNINGVPLYKLTHKNHPCAKWVRASSSNYIWLYKLLTLLCKEYTFRYGKIHKSCREYCGVLKDVPKNIPRGPMTEHYLAMPAKCIVRVNGKIDVIESYRNYYNTEKRHLASWKHRSVPYWYK